MQRAKTSIATELINVPFSEENYHYIYTYVYICIYIYIYIYIYNSAGLRPYALTQSGNQQSQLDHTAWNSMFQLACKWKIKDQCIWSSHFFADTNVINRLQQGVGGVGHPVVALDMACWYYPKHNASLYVAQVAIIGTSALTAIHLKIRFSATAILFSNGLLWIDQ